jgi:RNA polymerase-binding transcription factor DksA
MQNSIAQFSNDDVSNAVATFPPAQVVVCGLTVTEKKLSVVKQASSMSLGFLAGQAGKIGKAAREVGVVDSVTQIATQCKTGNYKPLADAIAALMGESLTISNRAAYQSLQDRFEDKLRDLKNGGYSVSKKTGLEIESPKRKALVQIINLIAATYTVAN